METKKMPPPPERGGVACPEDPDSREEEPENPEKCHKK